MNDFGTILRGIVIRCIEAEHDNPAEQKARILIARQHGHLTDQEAEDWLRILNLVEA